MLARCIEFFTARKFVTAKNSVKVSPSLGNHLTIPFRFFFFSSLSGDANNISHSINLSSIIFDIRTSIISIMEIEIVEIGS